MIGLGVLLARIGGFRRGSHRLVVEARGRVIAVG